MKKSHVLTESDIRKQIRDYLRIRGYLVLYFLQGLGCYPGLSDMCAIKDGQTLWLEIKKPGGKLSEKQIEFKRQIEAHGGTYIVVTGFEDLKI